MALKQIYNGLIMLLVGLLVVLPVSVAIKLKSKDPKYKRYIYAGFALSGGLIIVGIILMATATKDVVPPDKLPKTCDPLCSGMTPICEAGTCVKCDTIRMCPTATPYCNMDGSCTVPPMIPPAPTTTTTTNVPPPTTTTTTNVPPPTTTANVMPILNSDYSWVAWYDLDPNTPNPPEGTLGKTPWGSNLTVFPVAAINKNGKAIFGSTFTDKAARGTARAWYSRRNETGPDIGPNKGTAGMSFDVNNSQPLWVLKANSNAPAGCGDTLKRGDVANIIKFNGKGVCINDGYATAYDDTTKECEKWSDRPVGTFEPLSRAC